MIIGTAGHIDHGKSALVTALTGRPMDRLAEERRRGITIDLGFAPLPLDGLPSVGIVDVPGHEDFVRTMVAGASGIDLVLLVVDSGEGIRPQTLEHLQVVEQLGIGRGIPVLTKADLAEGDWLELVAAELQDRLAGSPVRFDAPVVTSAVTGRGLDDLRARIRHHAATLDPRPVDEIFRLPVDRVFAVAGIGTVVTGTVWSGSVGVGDAVTVEPGTLVARVRSVESFGAAVARAMPGARTALGLSGVSHTALARGAVVLSAARAWPSARAFDAVVRLAADAPAPLKGRDRVRVHLGTAEVMARVHPRTPIPPGGEASARIALEAPLHLRGGDRFVLRRYSPVVTVGGGVVLDPAPPRRAPWPPGLASPQPAERLTALIARRDGGMSERELPVLLGLPEAQALALATGMQGLAHVGDRWVPADLLDRLAGAVRIQLEAHHRDDPSSPGLSLETVRRRLGRRAWLGDEVLRRLGDDGVLLVAEGIVARRDFVPRARGGEAEVLRLVTALEAAGLEPPTVDELAAGLELTDFDGALRIAAGRGEIQAVERDRFYARAALERFLTAVREEGRSGAIVPAALRERLGLSRKYLIPLLEWSDRQGVTRRTPDGGRTLA